MSRLPWTVKLSAAVIRPFPIGRCLVRRIRRGIRVLTCIPVLFSNSHSVGAQQPPANLSSHLSPVVGEIVNRYCVTCHDGEMKKGGLALDRISIDDVAQHPDEWERVIRKLRTRQMPPLGKDRPTERTYDDVVARLSSSLDRASTRHPNPGRTATFRRLNRTEYRNAINARK